MSLACRAGLSLAIVLSLAGCASGRDALPAPIDFRSPAYGLRPSATGAVLASTRPDTPEQPRFSPSGPGAERPAPLTARPSGEPGPLQLVVDLGPSVGLSATEEARALPAQPGGRPGGARRVAPGDPGARDVQVMSGDTLYDISRRYNVNMRALIEANQLTAPFALEVGGVIRLPPPNVHVVQAGETLYAVSRRYNVDLRSLALLNGLSRPWLVYPGDELLLPSLARDLARAPAMLASAASRSAMITPDLSRPGPLAAPPPLRSASAAGSATATAAAAPAAGPLRSPASPAASAARPPAAAAPAPTRSPPRPSPAASAGPGDFIWPVSGELLKGYGPAAGGRNDGVNIAAARGSPIRAAGGGEVVYAGSELAGFGNLILIRHPGGWVTAYAHADSMAVREGDLVRQGQAIATVGATGNVSTPQVHFELRKGKEPVDPAQHLPPL